MFMKTHAVTLAMFASLAAGPLAAGQAIPTAVYTAFNPATNSFTFPIGGPRTLTSFNGIHRSPNGQRWLLVANVSGDTGSDQALIAGQGSARTLVVQQGQAVPNLPTRNVNIIDDHRINDAGQFAFECNTTGSGSPSLLFHVGSLSPAVSFGYVAGSGEAVPFLAGSTYSGGYFGTLLDNTGRYGFQTGINDGASTSAAIIFNGAVLSRAQDLGLAPIPGDPWAGYVQRRIFTDATGGRFLWWGATNGAPPTVSNVVALDNVPIVQVGSAIPGLADPTPVDSVFSVWLEPSGRWFVRGALGQAATPAAERADFVYSNSTIVARRGQPITPGSSATWDRFTVTSTTNGFLFNVGNGRGDYAVAGWTLDGATRAPAVVLNGTTVVARAGDPIDANADGQANDNAFIASFKQEIGQGSAYLNDAGELVMNVSARNAVGTTLGEAIVRLQLTLAPLACRADFDQSGTRDVSDIFAFLSAWFAAGPGSDFDQSGTRDVSDIFAFLSAWFAGCPTP